MLKFIFCLIANIMDFVSGYVAAAKNGRVTSVKMREGLYKKLAYILTYITMALASFWIEGVGVISPACYTICGYIFLMELTSIAENISKINPKIVPDFILKILNKED